MNCKQARRLMQQLLDGDETERTPLEDHLAECPSCRAEFQALRATQAAVGRAVKCDVPSGALQRATEGALQVIRYHHTAVHAGRRWLAVGVAAGVLAAFGLGLVSGRSMWPQEIVQVRTVPQVVEKIVRVEVPVIEERMVVKRIPVVRTRIVYRERETAAPAEAAAVLEASVPGDASELTTGEAAEPEAAAAGPVVPEQYVIRLESTPVFFGYTVSEYSRPAATVEEPGPPEALPDAEQDQGAQDATGAELADQIAAMPATGATVE